MLLLLAGLEEERLTVDYGFEQGLDLEAFADSLYALDELWTEYEPESRLALTSVRSGSAIADFAPYVLVGGVTAAAMGTSVTISDFVRKMGKALRAFSEMDSKTSFEGVGIGDEVSNLLGAVANSGGYFSLKHTRKISPNETVIVTEASFDPPKVARIMENLERREERLLLAASEEKREWTELVSGVELYLDQVSKDPPKQSGRSRDRGIVPALDSRPRPLFFAAQSNLKEEILEATENPMKTEYVVDLLVNRKGRSVVSYELIRQRRALLLE